MTYRVCLCILLSWLLFSPSIYASSTQLTSHAHTYHNNNDPSVDNQYWDRLSIIYDILFVGIDARYRLGGKYDLVPLVNASVNSWRIAAQQVSTKEPYEFTLGSIQSLSKRKKLPVPIVGHITFVIVPSPSLAQSVHITNRNQGGSSLNYQDQLVKLPRVADGRATDTDGWSFTNASVVYLFLQKITQCSYDPPPIFQRNLPVAEWVFQGIAMHEMGHSLLGYTHPSYFSIMSTPGYPIEGIITDNDRRDLAIVHQHTMAHLGLI